MAQCLNLPSLADPKSGQRLLTGGLRTVEGNALTIDDPVLPKVALGEPAAVSDCINRYGDLVWSLARRSCPDVQSAEDAVQDIFLKLWSVADRFDPQIASESTFIAMIARRKLIDLNRKRSATPTAPSEFDSLLTPGISAAERAEINDEAARASKLLDQLPSDQQQVIRLSVYEGLSHARIADATGLALGTVKTHLRRGILKLRDSLFPSTENELATPEIPDGGHQ